MAVEILILSGARQREQLVLNGNEFRVGTEPGCDVLFDHQRDPAAKDHGALLRLEDDGWYIRPTGSGRLTVNQQTVAGLMRLRSGDVIGLSPSGPEFCFRLQVGEMGTSQAAKATATLSQTKTSLPLSSLESPVSERQAVTGSETSKAVFAFSAAAWPWTKWAIGGLAACALLAVLWRVLQPPPVPQVNIHLGDKSVEAAKEEKKSLAAGQESRPPAIEGQAPVAHTNSHVGEQHSERAKEDKKSQAARQESEPPAAKGEPPAPPAKMAMEPLRDAVFLVHVEKAGRFWPFATCVAVDKQTLLTSAREAMQLAEWREKEGFNLWAVNPVLGMRKKIREIRLHGVFSTIAEKPNDWIYFNLALLSVEGDLPKIAPLAAPEELGELKEEAAVRCFGFTHEGKKTSETHKFEPQLIEGRIFMTTVAKDLPGQPRLLHIEAKIPPNAYGSPILNQKGSLVGIYGSPASPPDQDGSPAGMAVKDIHFAAVVTPDIIRQWTEKRDEKVWVLHARSAPPGQSRNGEQ